MFGLLDPLGFRIANQNRRAVLRPVQKDQATPRGARGIPAATLAVICVLIGNLAVAQESANTSRLHNDLREIVQWQADAWNAGNLEKFMEAYWRSDRLTFSSGGNVTRGWDQTLDRYRQRYGDKESMGALTFSELEVSELGGDAALMLGRFQLIIRGEKLGGNFTLVWRKIDGKWKIIHDHTSSDQPPTRSPTETDQNG